MLDKYCDIKNEFDNGYKKYSKGLEQLSDAVDEVRENAGQTLEDLIGDRIGGPIGSAIGGAIGSFFGLFAGAAQRAEVKRILRG